MIKVNVDLQRCDANGTCAALMPDLFRIDQAGRLEQLRAEVEEERGDDLEEVIHCCPMGAITRT
ncbi:ferredoxin [Pseudarthrobacter sp. fls2-241-R2A-168]|uniref:ferredoxin n=1 Tax=Pseudarthrobacter sp. fls2-241-R2A-168 TaxID=3040304 RepID=UPI002554AA66|nr:ferredoxin [Pseudarthrobacter sp. fls2-241-R2A-168]